MKSLLKILLFVAACFLGFSADLSAATAPAITTQPANKTVNAGASASFTVVATGTPAPMYQWKKGTTAISGATSATYTIAAAATGDAGSYSVVVTNSAGTATSANATLTVNVSPAITTQPASKTVNAGASASFTVVATGTPAPTYQWKKGTTAISGATSATYTIAAVATGDAGTYSVVVTNSAGTATSTGATLTVTAAVAPTITTQPASKTVNAGASASFTVVATGTPAPTYQWKKGTTAISGATSATYTIAAAATGDAGTYSVVVTNSAGTATSTGATLTVTAAVAPTITTQPASKTVNAGASASFTVAATGTPAPTYQWKKGTTAISGATSATYTIAAAATGDAGTYSVVVTNSAGTATSTGATLTVTTAVAPTITTQPASKTVNAGASASFTVVATGTPAPTYQWKKGTATISGATSATYTIASVATGNAGTYSVVVTNSAGSVTSNNATLTLNTPPAVSITAPPAYSVFDLPTTITVTATASDPDGTVSKVEFYKNSTLAVNKIGEKLAAPYSINWTVAAPGAVSLLAVATDNQNATTTSAPVGIQLRPTLPYTADFEASEGYTVGSLDNQLGWVVTAGAAQIVNTTASSGTQSVVLSPGASAARIDQEFGASATPPPVVYVDFFSKPVAGSDSDNGTLYETDVAQLAFVLYAASGQFAVYDGDGAGGGTWLNLPLPVATDASHVTTTWQRITLRIDFVAKTWDLYLNGQLLAPDLGFRLDSASALSLFALRGNATAATGFDDFYVGAASPLFTDSNADGIDDAWEIAHGLSLSVNQRNLDPDNDGLTNIQEYEHGTDPHTADTDGDGLTDGVEVALGTDPLTVGSYGPALPVSGARLHLCADLGPVADGNGFVSRWLDLSGHGNDAVQSESSLQPGIVSAQLNGHTVVRFNQANNTWLGLPDVMAGASEGEAFVVLRKSATENIVGLWAFGNGGGSRYPEYTNIVNDDFATNQWYDTGPAPAPEILTDFHIYNVGGDSATWFQNFNGLPHFRQNGNTVLFRSNPTLGEGQGCQFDGDIAEVIMYDHVLSPSERDSIGRYLTQKYLPATIPVPAKPILTAFAVTRTKVDLSWSRPSVTTMHTVATIERQVGGGAFSAVATVSDTNSFTDTGLESGQIYTYRLTLNSWAGASPASDLVAIITPLSADLPATGVRLWLRSTAGLPSTGGVARWGDQSGHGNDAIQPELLSQPSVVQAQANGYPAVHFDRTKWTTLSVPNLMTGATAGEVFAVLRKSTASAIVGLWSFGGGPGSRYPEYTNRINDDFATNQWYDTGAAPLPASLTSFHVYNVGGDVTTWFQSFNGVEHYRHDGNTVGFRNTAILGDGQGCYFDGDIVEIIVYDRILSTADRSAVNDYLSQKYPMGWGVVDVGPPTTPTGLATSSMTANSICLSWNASTDDVAVAGYLIYGDNGLLAATSTTSVNLTGLVTGASYNLMVRARDAAGKLSAIAGPLTVTIRPPWPWGADPTGDADGDGVPNCQDAQATDAAVGRLNVTITAPAEGSVIP